MEEVKKAVVLAAGLGTRFLPVSKIVSKEVLPLVDRPIIQYLLEEIKESGISQVVLVLNPERKAVVDYFTKSDKLEKFLKERKKEKELVELKLLEELRKNISLSYVFQKQPLGDGQAILETESKIGKNPFAVLFCDDVFVAKTPILKQLLEVFKTCQRPVIGLRKVPEEEISKVGICESEKIAHRIYKIKKIIEKPEKDKAPSDLGVLGRYILLPEIFEYLKKSEPFKTGEIILANALDAALKDGKTIYGYEIKDEYLSCGDKFSWLKSNLYLALCHPQYGKELKNYLKKII